jgi:hypothetical protein
MNLNEFQKVSESKMGSSATHSGNFCRSYFTEILPKFYRKFIEFHQISPNFTTILQNFTEFQRNFTEFPPNLFRPVSTKVSESSWKVLRRIPAPSADHQFQNLNFTK